MKKRKKCQKIWKRRFSGPDPKQNSRQSLKNFEKEKGVFFRKNFFFEFSLDDSKKHLCLFFFKSRIYRKKANFFPRFFPLLGKITKDG